MKKQIRITRTRTARVVTIPSDYFKIHEAYKAPIEAFDFSEDQDGTITLVPVRRVK